MTEKDFIKSLGASERKFIQDVRDALAGNTLKAAVLLNGEVVPTDMVVAMMWQMHHAEDMRVGRDEIGKVVVSTVFLTQPHSGPGSKDNFHFETMVFGEFERNEGRYRTLSHAQEGHRRACQKYRDHYEGEGR